MSVVASSLYDNLVLEDKIEALNYIMVHDLE